MGGRNENTSISSSEKVSVGLEIPQSANSTIRQLNWDC